ncbi:MAG: phosphoglucomutase [Ignavibacteriaceae bacterium]|nr:phosphoglucomutase [Ignavibacteriaceae bacterium]
MGKEIIFGTDGWRGLIDSEVNQETTAAAAQAFADYLANREGNKPIKCAVGYDGRKYSKEFAFIFAEVLSGNGIEVDISNSVIPTPVLSFYVKAKMFSAGAMITASHNPKEYNGIKFKNFYGGPFLTEETIKVEAHLNKSIIKTSRTNVYEKNFLPLYFDQLEKYIDFNLISGAGLNVLIDSMAGAGQLVIETILKKHKINCKTIYEIAQPDFAGRMAEPIENNLMPLSKELQNGNYSLGIATDGDADRCGLMLDDGKWLSAQETILLLADYIVNVKNISGALVKTSSVTDKLSTHFKTATRDVFDVQVGFKYICEKMISEDIAFGAEESGGFGYKDHIPERDGILSGLIFCEMLAAHGVKKLSEYLNQKRKQFGNIFYKRLDIHYNKPDRSKILPQLFLNPPTAIAKFNLHKIKAYYSSRGIINGIKFTLGENNRWLLIRSSETEPLIRIYAEGESDSDVKNFLEAATSFFSSRSI